MSLCLPAAGNRLGQDDAGSVHGLEDAHPIHAPRDLADQHRGYTLRTQLLVHTQEVNLNHLLHSESTIIESDRLHND
jgi:hypothetical protein